MASDRPPHVSIGVPVYNGERYLAQALDSILAQTFSDYEIIISDNGSTDATPDICRMYAAQDPRIKFHRHDHNRGSAWNYNRVFELSSGTYFGWLSHDDVYDPRFLERCVEVLDSRPDVVVTHARMYITDEFGHITEQYGHTLQADDPAPHKRFYELIRRMTYCTPIYGLIRAETLAMTPVIGAYPSADMPLLAQLGLLGPIYEIPEYLFYHRRHPGHAMALDRFARAVWLAPAKSGRIVFPEWRLFRELLRCVKEVPLPLSERICCLAYALCWPAWSRHWRSMTKEVVLAALQTLRLSRRRTVLPSVGQ